MIHLLLVDDHASFRESLAFLLAHQTDITVSGQAGSLAEARRIIPELDVDIALVDLHLPDGSGVDLIRDMRRLNPEALILVITGARDELSHAMALEAGASGILNKIVATSTIIEAIRRLAEGEQILTVRETMDLFRLVGNWRLQHRDVIFALDSLTPREHEILEALADGLSDKEIALRFSIGAKTVRNHMTSILSKLGVDSRLQALLLAIRHGAIELALDTDPASLTPGHLSQR
jgi:two-component system, NarL family, response regulator DevR